jgi:3-methyladenine DNA glycosylase AlkD
MVTPKADRALPDAIRASLRRAADPGRAPAMQAYMKSAMPYLGVAAPERRALVRRAFAAHPLASAASWQKAVRELWRKAAYREERYAAVELLFDRRYRAFLDLDALALLEELIVTGAWWDYVDPLAAHGLGHLLREEPRKMKRTLRAWSRDPDLWKRRSAILAQLGMKREIDLDLLYDCIEPNLVDPEFFIRKAIGWALRQHAWTDPAEVKRKVRALGPRLSPLSRREALKNVATRSKKQTRRRA